MLVALGLGAVLFGCKPDQVDPSGNKGTKDSGLAGVFDELHPNLDTVCKLADSVYFRSTDGSWNVNVCNDGEFFSPQVVPCVGPQPRWGSFSMYNGYEYRHDANTGLTDTIHMLDVDFTLAPGIFCVFTDWIFTIDGAAIIDQNTGLPIAGTDWGHMDIDPLRNEWKIRVPIADLPNPCFDLACKMHTVQLSLFEGAIAGSDVDLWAVNSNWDNPANEAASVSEYVVRYCPFACLEQPAAETTTECVNVQRGWTGQLAGCATLDATSAGATYTWSTGETTATIDVCPTEDATYSVTVVSGTKTEITNYDVKVEDVRCGNPTQPQHKVWVCHVPPGNPNNPQDICIDWDGVPSHVAKYRVAGVNYRQGHDSGCEIGHCGGNPCD